MQREYLGPSELAGDVLVAITIPVLLWNDLPHVLLAAWGILVAVIPVTWELVEKRYPRGDSGESDVYTILGWIDTAVWASLPWFDIGVLADRGVVWVMVFVVVIGMAGDTIFHTQTSEVAIDEMVIAYTASFVIAFAVAGAYLAVLMVFVAFGTIVFGGSGFSRIMAELVAEREQSNKQAREDALTGLGTRAVAVEAVEAIRDEQSIVHCVFVDLDDFKQLNDNYGYEVGDLALRWVGSMLSERLPAEWVLCRFGGDEFVGVGPSDIDVGVLLEQRIPIEILDGLVISQTLSAGLTSLSAAEADADRLFSEASTALRHAKQEKGRSVRMTDELRESEVRRVDLMGRAASAIDDREIVPWAQPIVELCTGRFAALELLARWPQPDGTVAMPGEFVPVLEDQGRGPELGMLMIEHAIGALSTPELRRTGISVSVNVSARHLYHRRLPVEILDLLQRADVSPQHLVLEITETEPVGASSLWKETAEALREIGVGLAIDDFGTGYSSVEQLLSMPFSQLKIDQVFTGAIERPGAAELTAGMVALARGAGMTVVAEGVETEEQRRRMQNAGCDHAQGFLFARPAPLEAMIERLSSRTFPSAPARGTRSETGGSPSGAGSSVREWASRSPNTR